MKIFKKVLKSLLVLSFLSGFLFVPGSVQSGSGTMRSYPVTNFIQTRNTNTTHDLNQATSQEIPITGTVDYSDSLFEVQGNGIKVGFNGYIRVYASFYMTSVIQRASPKFNLKINSNVLPVTTASAYIRASTSHYRASSSFFVIAQVQKDDVIYIVSELDNTGAVGVVTMVNGQSLLTIERIK